MAETAVKTKQAIVYANGKTQKAEVGQRAGEFGGEGYDFMVVNPDHEEPHRLVDRNYQLVEGDTLTVTARGVAGLVTH